MFIHSVYFWLRGDLTPSEHHRFADGLRSLAAINSVEQADIGVPAPTDRPVIERGYSRALILTFKDEGAHDAYQSHPVHDRFRADCGGYWTSVRIFDVLTSGPE